jgi:hypothetical protein
MRAAAGKERTMATTHYAAIDATNVTGTVYGLGTTAEEALADALSVGTSCFDECAEREDHEPGDHFRVVPCTAEAAAFIESSGGSPSPRLSVSARSGVSLVEEDD